VVISVDVCKSAQGLPKCRKLTEEHIEKTALGGPYLRNALLYSRDTSHCITEHIPLEDSTPSRQPHLEPRPVSIKCLLMENSTTEPTSHSVQLVLTAEDVDGAKLQAKSHLRNTTRMP